MNGSPTAPVSPTRPAVRSPTGPAGLLGRGRDQALALFRVVTGLLFACHGAATLFDVLGDPHGGVPEFGAWPGWWAAAIQLAGGGLVLLGLWTRAAALVCSGSMAYAYFTVHQAEALFPIENGGEASAMFCWSFLLIAVLGPGSWALDALFSGTNATRKAGEPSVLTL